ncbi:hypothetical protein NUW54_g13115 [Trametes sanguinea]|uniref:Uncharacterized protein n=1 Tax=Trametes sanguinea TaxID=158606 RepID=A0ACC1MQ04_9APHY|nr:hypothetical protein NUW54_g13115 [Trametes sanguinea]
MSPPTRSVGLRDGVDTGQTESSQSHEEAAEVGRYPRQLDRLRAAIVKLDDDKAQTLHSGEQGERLGTGLPPADLNGLGVLDNTGAGLAALKEEDASANLMYGQVSGGGPGEAVKNTHREGVHGNIEM